MNERSIFVEALEKEDRAQRSAFLDMACAGDAPLRQRLEALLKSHDDAGGFLDKLAPERMAEDLARQTLGETQGEVPPGDREDIDLSFLTPSEKPGSLGRLAHYEILEVVGQGGMGIVLRAFDEKLHRVVAIKVMAAALAITSPPRRRFLREARAAAAVRHDHVVDIHAVEEQPIPYLVMEYISGETLQQKLDRVGPLEVPEVLRLGQQIARGLEAAHAQGLIHRDIKPSNILLEKGAEERVKITDFGLARAAADASLTQSGVIVGTPMYMAPEQTLGEAIDHRADLFSLGSVLYTMCSGRPPFRATQSMVVLKRVAEDTPRPIREIIPEVPQWLCDIIAKLHAKKPEDRFQTAKEVADLLGQHRAHLEHPSLAAMPVAATPIGVAPAPVGVARPEYSKGVLSPTPFEDSGRATRRRRWTIAAAIFLLLIGGLSLTEATGVTNLRSTVIRILTPDGTLVVEVDDPGVKVTVEGDGGLVIAGAGLHEVRLKPGSYKVHADKDGKKVQLERELISIAKGGREIVRVKLEAPPAQAIAKTDKGPFVLLSGHGGDQREFHTLAEAVLKARSNDTIEIRGNGPFATGPLDLGSKALTIRAGSGFTPLIKPNQAAVKGDAHLMRTGASLTLEGLELHHEGLPETPVTACTFLAVSYGAPIYLSNCKLIVNRKDCSRAIGSFGSTRGQVRNCIITSPGHALELVTSPKMHWSVENCMIAAGHNAFYLVPHGENSAETKFRVTHSTLVGRYAFNLGIGDSLASQLSDKPAKIMAPFAIECEEAVFQVWRILGLNDFTSGGKGMPLEVRRRTLTTLFRWRKRTNVYGTEDKFSISRGDEEGNALHALANLAEWNKFWGIMDTGSLHGPVLLRGTPKDFDRNGSQDITPDDFRLVKGSAGYQAGKDKKDLGADVDLVGPGPAYERWKKTPEYQQWLKDTKQFRKADAPTAEPKAFVVLRDKGIEVRKYDTLAEAVQGASDGDTIEVRGNGPFVCGPVKLTHALTIRAAEGFRPVLQFAENLRTNAPLVLEGLELQRVRQKVPQGSEEPLVDAWGSPSLHIVNCRFREHLILSCVQSNAPTCVLRNCEFLSPLHRAAVLGGKQCVIDNCLAVGWGMLELRFEVRRDQPDISVQITCSTLRSSEHALLVQLHLVQPDKLAEKDVRRVRVDASGTIFDAASVVVMNEVEPFLARLRPQPEDAKALLLRMLAWRDQGNLYAPGGNLLLWNEPPKGVAREIGPRSLADWQKLWASGEGDAVEGRIKYQGGDLLAKLRTAPEKLTSEDFRLRPDSAGYKAGKDGKDGKGLGADVDLVGPGPAYERWKKTPEYQQWLKETGQLKATSAPTTELGAFVILGGKGVEVGKHDTLAEAVKRASDGDTIEIRGNGPFVTDPLNLNRQALTIRAGLGFRPVVSLAKKHAQGGATALTTKALLVLEGIDFQLPAPPSKEEQLGTFLSSEGPLGIGNCRFGAETPAYQDCILATSPRIIVRNCEFLNAAVLPLHVGCLKRMRCDIQNCLHAGHHFLGMDHYGRGDDVEIRLTNNTLLSGTAAVFYFGVVFDPAKDRADRPIRIEASGNLLDALGIFHIYPGTSNKELLQPANAETVTRSILAWQDREDLYDVPGFITWHDKGPDHALKSLADWKKFWGKAADDAREGKMRYHGGHLPSKLRAGPAKLTPDDFRLCEGSAGYQAGKNKRDLGADVDLVGPGAAYERWKKTPEYQQWLKDSGQVK